MAAPPGQHCRKWVVDYAQLLQGQYFFAESVCWDDAPGLLRCVPFLDEGHLWRTGKTGCFFVYSAIGFMPCSLMFPL